MTHLGEGDVCCDLCGCHLRREEAVEIVNSKGWRLHFCRECDRARRFLIRVVEILGGDNP